MMTLLLMISICTAKYISMSLNIGMEMTYHKCVYVTLCHAGDFQVPVWSIRAHLSFIARVVLMLLVLMMSAILLLLLEQQNYQLVQQDHQQHFHISAALLKMASQETIPSFYECLSLLGVFVCKKQQHQGEIVLVTNLRTLMSE